MQKLTPFGRAKKIRPKKSLTWLLQAALQLMLSDQSFKPKQQYRNVILVSMNRFMKSNNALPPVATVAHRRKQQQLQQN